jgi:uracil-DNA glycosylase
MSGDPLEGHLKLFSSLGVSGISRSAAWRDRVDAPDAPADASESAAIADDAIADVARIDIPSAEGAAGSSGRPTGPDELSALRDEIGDCTRCPLHALGRTQVVFGVGNPAARLMFVGEAPGADEDLRGEPFVGRAGQLLTKIIEAMGFAREDVYIANVIKCRPPGNRNPEPIEVATCQPFLFRQIDMIRPKAIVALGTFAAHALLGTDAPISRLRGQVHDFRNGSKLIPTFHPAFLLRSPERKRDVWEDMKKVRALLADEQ